MRVTPGDVRIRFVRRNTSGFPARFCNTVVEGDMKNMKPSEVVAAAAGRAKNKGYFCACCGKRVNKVSIAVDSKNEQYDACDACIASGKVALCER